MKVVGPLAAACLLVAQSVAAPRKAPAAAPLPDSVLARIDRAGATPTDVTMSRFRRAATQFRADPQRLTPAQARGILELLVQQRILAEHVAAFPRGWSHDDSVDYATLLDRTTLTAALDSATTELTTSLAAHGDSIPSMRELGIMVRDTAVAKLSPVYDDYMIEMLATDFRMMPKPSSRMSPTEQLRVLAMLPQVTRDDSTKTLIRTSMGSYTIGELLTDFGRLNAARRPRIETPDDVRGLINSTIYEKLLRQHIVAQDLEHRPDLAAALAEHAEFLDVQAYVRREVYGRVPTDSATLRRHFAANRSRFDSYGRADIVRMVFDTRAEADSLARRLRIPGQADTLAALSARGGIPFRTTLAEEADTLLFRRVARAGPGAVVGPDTTIDGWRVIGVMKITPRHPRPFDDVYAYVAEDWVERDGDRRLRELMAKLQGSAGVRTNEAALAKLAPVPRRKAK
jgi:hypothetical protein